MIIQSHYYYNNAYSLTELQSFFRITKLQRIEIISEGKGPRQNSENSRCQESVLVAQKMSILLKKSKLLEKAGTSFASSVVSLNNFKVI